ncbi:MAG: polysaccharide deacetylase family protein [Crocinitomicaceae bacterium]
MRLYTFPKWLRWLYPGAIWEISSSNKEIYLTFDDGPNKDITHYILDLMNQFDAKATFFCLGNQIEKFPEHFEQIKAAGHAIGNHSMTHMNGWWTKNEKYLADVTKAAELIDSKLYRPPYGRISLRQFKKLKKMGYQVVFWSVVSYDFDPGLRKKKLRNKMERLTKPGAVFVFHDNPKAMSVLEMELPKLMKFWKDEGYEFKAIPMSQSQQSN